MTIMGKLMRAGLFGVAAGSAACSSAEPVDLGESVTGEELRDYTGVWSGYVEAFDFAGSDRLRLTVGEDGSGSFEVGEQPPLAPPEDPNVGYPVGWTGADIMTRPPLISGFAYPLHGTRVEASRILFGLEQLEVFAEWCGMQTPVLREENDPDAGYGCMPSVATTWGKADGCGLGDPGSEEFESRDCGWMVLCEEVCTACSAESCSVSPHAAPASFDAALEDGGQILTGTLLLPGDFGEQRVTVHMTREH
jgi:hypothetical protein